MKSKKNVGILPTLKNIAVNNSATFDLYVYKYSVISAAIYRVQTDSTAKFKMRKNGETNVLEVTRIA